MLWFLIIGIIVGWLAGNVIKSGGFGLVSDMVLGVVGAFTGGYLFRLFGISAYGLVGEISMATMGPIILLSIIRLFRGKLSS